MAVKMLARVMVVGSLVAYAGCSRSECPDDSTMMGDPPPKGFEQVCKEPDGTKQGKWTAWYDNGQKKEEGEYKDGIRHGKWSDWLRNGQQVSEVEYKHGEEIGRATICYFPPAHTSDQVEEMTSRALKR